MTEPPDVCEMPMARQPWDREELASVAPWGGLILRHAESCCSWGFCWVFFQHVATFTVASFLWKSLAIIFSTITVIIPIFYGFRLHRLSHLKTILSAELSQRLQAALHTLGCGSDSWIPGLRDDRELQTKQKIQTMLAKYCVTLPIYLSSPGRDSDANEEYSWLRK